MWNGTRVSYDHHLSKSIVATKPLVGAFETPWVRKSIRNLNLKRSKIGEKRALFPSNRNNVTLFTQLFPAPFCDTKLKLDAASIVHDELKKKPNLLRTYGYSCMSLRRIHIYTYMRGKSLRELWSVSPSMKSVDVLVLNSGARRRHRPLAQQNSAY